MRKSILALVLSFSLLNAFSQDKRIEGLDSFINRLLKDYKAAGLAIAIVEKNKIVLLKGYGYRDLEKKIPVNDETLFAIGSCTKAFTSSLLGILSQENKLDIDKPVFNYLPELRFYNEGLSEQVTTRDMMSHRTGLPRHDYSWYGSSVGRDSLLRRIRYFEPSAPLREKWQYNNFMFLAQGMLSEKISGKKWETLLSEKIFTPLGMTNSSTSISALENSSNASVGYRVKNDSIIMRMKYMNIDAIGPAGSINSNVKDMAKWVTTWIYGGKYNGKEIIPASYAIQAISSQMVIGAGLPSAESPDLQFSNYGLAWFLSSYRGHYRVEHGGNIDGFSANTSFFPTDSIGIVILTNQNGSSLPSIIRNTIIDKMLKLPYRNWDKIIRTQINKSKEAATTRQNSDSLNRKLGTKPSHAISDYEGRYNNDGYGTVVITRTGDSLGASFNTIKLRLRHYHYDIFNAWVLDESNEVEPQQDPQKFRFEMNNKGDIQTLAISLESSVADIKFTKEVISITIKKEDLEKFVGEYELSGVKAKFYLKNDSTLALLVPGQPEYELIPVKQDEFNLKNASGFSCKFLWNDKKEIDAVQFNQPNGVFKATKIKAK